MKPSDDMMPDDEYERLLAEAVRPLAANDPVGILPRLAACFDVRHVEIFTDNLHDKRISKLTAELADLDGVIDLDRLVAEYNRAEPMAPYERRDELNFLRWVLRNQPLPAEVQDQLRWEAARFRMEIAARRAPAEFRRFQEAWSVVGVVSPTVHRNWAVRAVVNPARASVRFRTGEFLPPDVPPPATVTRVCVGEEVRTVLLEPPAMRAVGQLARRAEGGKRLRPWLHSWPEGARDAVRTVRTLASLGLVAFC